MAEKTHCASCMHWKNHQMLLNYHEELGFCVNPMFGFNTTDGRFIGVVDCESLRDRVKISGNPSNDFETHDIPGGVKPSQYMLQTSDMFGCNFHQTKRK